MATRILTLAMLLSFGAPLNSAPVPKAAKTLKDRVAGVWELAMSRGERPSSLHIITFTRDGVMTIEVGRAPNTIRYQGTYKLTGNAIDYEMKQADYNKAEKLTIKLISDTEMRTTDPEGIDEHFIRIRD